MKIFKVTGTFKMGPNGQSFIKETIAKNEKAAVEKIYSDFGGKHNLKRKDINITKVKNIKPEEATDIVITQMFENKMVEI